MNSFALKFVLSFSIISSFLSPSYAADPAEIIVQDTGTAVANGNALKAAYTTAKSMTPYGSAKSATNRVTISVAPGTYDLGASGGQAGLTMDTQYIDLVGVGTRENVRITSAGRTIVQTANDVEIANCTLITTSANGA
jgi:hypothetical protein